MSHDLRQLVRIRELRKDRAERTLQAQQEALCVAQAKVAADRDDLASIVRGSRTQQNKLGEGVRSVSEALFTMSYVAAQRLEAKQVTLRMHRSSAEAARVDRRVKSARDEWHQRARAHEALRLQEETLRKQAERVERSRQDEAVADEHVDSWIARMAATRELETGA